MEWRGRTLGEAACVKWHSKHELPRGGKECNTIARGTDYLLPLWLDYHSKKLARAARLSAALKDYGKLLEDFELADVTFAVDGQRFQDHTQCQHWHFSA